MNIPAKEIRFTKLTCNGDTFPQTWEETFAVRRALPTSQLLENWPWSQVCALSLHAGYHDDT